MTIYGLPPRDTFPEAATKCLTGIVGAANSQGDADARLYVLDRCAGFMVELERN